MMMLTRWGTIMISYSITNENPISKTCFYCHNISNVSSEIGVERNRNQETGSFQELLEFVISGNISIQDIPIKHQESRILVK